MDKPIELTGSTVADFALHEMARQMMRDQPFTESGRGAKTLAKGDAMTVVLGAASAGTRLGEHIAPGPVTLLLLSGQASFIWDDGDTSLEAGTAIAFAPDVRHSVRAEEDCYFLLIIGGKHAE